MTTLAPALKSLPSLSGSTPLGRPVDYMRISVTDRCNERCLYCLPEQFQEWMPRENILSYDEILAIVGVAVARGFKHFRITGGEPLVRRRSRLLPSRTDRNSRGGNGATFHKRGRFCPTWPMSCTGPACGGSTSASTRLTLPSTATLPAVPSSRCSPVFSGRKNLAFTSIKLNTVLIRHRNEDQILPLVQFAAARQMPIRFIELMPVSLTEMLTEENFLP